VHLYCEATLTEHKNDEELKLKLY